MSCIYILSTFAWTFVVSQQGYDTSDARQDRTCSILILAIQLKPFDLHSMIDVLYPHIRVGFGLDGLYRWQVRAIVIYLHNF